MAIRNFSNTARPTSLTAPLNNSSTTISVVSTAGFPATPFIAAIDRGTEDEEVVLVTDKSPTTFTVVRGFDSTTKLAHNNGAPVEHCSAAADYRESNTHINDTTLDHHTQYLNLSRARVYFPQAYQTTSFTHIDPINTSYKQIATLTIPAASFPRKIQLTARITYVWVTANIWVTLAIRRGATIVNNGSDSTISDVFATLNTTSAWLNLEPNVTQTYNMAIRRESGSGGTTSDRTTARVFSALAIPDL